LLLGRLPSELVRHVLQWLPQFGGALALILGALVAGSEYGWGTRKSALTHHPARRAVFISKVRALGVVVTAIVLIELIAAVTTSARVASAQEMDVQQASAPVIAFQVGRMLDQLPQSATEQQAVDLAEQWYSALQWPTMLERARGTGTAWLILAVEAA
jgi:hypothetical protein